MGKSNSSKIRVTSKIIDKGELAFKEQSNNFRKEAGKKLAIASAFIIVTVITSGIIPLEYKLDFIAGMLLVAISGTSYFSYRAGSRDSKIVIERLENTTQELHHTTDRLEEIEYKTEQIELSLFGKISALEENLNQIFFEINLETNQIEGSNPDFRQKLGWEVDEVNERIRQMESVTWVNWVSNTLIDPNDRSEFVYNMKNLTTLKSTTKYKSFITKKNGIEFPGWFTAYFNYQPEIQYIYCFITDETDLIGMRQTIDSLNALTKNLITALQIRTNESEETKKIITRLQKAVNNERRNVK